MCDGKVDTLGSRLFERHQACYRTGMTKQEMATALTWYYPRTSVGYWLRFTRATVELNYHAAVNAYGLMPFRLTPSYQASLDQRHRA